MKVELTRLNKLQMMTLDSFTDWLDKHGEFDGSPWIKWWEKKYCQACDSELVRDVDTGREMECAWCELHGKCRFFQEMDYVPDNKDIIKMWLDGKGYIE